MLYQYQLIKYIPDLTSEEFIHLGFVMYVPEITQGRHYITPNLNRTKAFFSKAPDYWIPTLESGLESLEKGLFSMVYLTDLQETTQRVLPANNNSLQLTSVKHGICLKETQAYSCLRDFIERYNY